MESDLGDLAFVADLSQVPSVSIVLPTYNREATIKESVESVLGQTYTDFELIVVDDGSSDGTMAILSKIADRRLKVLRHSSNRGGNAARNTGIRVARGHYVAFQDSDDEWRPQKLQKQLSVLEASGPESIGVYCGMIILGHGNNGSLRPVPELRYIPAPSNDVSLEGSLKRSLLQGLSFISTQTFLVKRDVLLDCGGFDESLRALQDWDCFIRVADYGPIAFVPEPLVIQRLSSDSLTHSTVNRVESMARIIDKHRVELTKMPKSLAEHYYILGGGYRRLGRFQTAQRYFVRSLRFGPLRLRTWMNLAYTSLARSVSFIRGFLIT